MNTTRIIEAYLDGSLEKDVAEEVRIRSENDIEFADLIRLHKEVNKCISDDELVKFRVTLKKISGENEISEREINISIRYIFQIAAACLFLILIGFTVKKWLFTGSSDSTIFNKYYVRYEADVITRSDNTATNSLEYAQILYQTGNYAKSEAILSEITNKDKKNYMAWFYSGLVRIELRQTGEAIRDFSKIPLSWNSPNRIHRNWYLALCLVKTGHEKEAGSLLMDLSTDNMYYSERAKKILKEIRF